MGRAGGPIEAAGRLADVNCPLDRTGSISNSFWPEIILRLLPKISIAFQGLFVGNRCFCLPVWLQVCGSRTQMAPHRRPHARGSELSTASPLGATLLRHHVATATRTSVGHKAVTHQDLLTVLCYWRWNGRRSHPGLVPLHDPM
jgi:hypothetical protein